MNHDTTDPHPDHQVERSSTTEGLPVAPSMGPAMEAAEMGSQAALVDERAAVISTVCVGLAVAAALVAQGLVRLIALVTNLSFYGRLSFRPWIRGSIIWASGWCSCRSPGR
jgi:hypothetical protein